MKKRKFPLDRVKRALIYNVRAEEKGKVFGKRKKLLDKGGRRLIYNIRAECGIVH